MTLYELLQAYEFEEIMPVIVDMFPGTSKYEKPLREAYNLLLQMRPAPSKKSIRYKILKSENGNEQYMGAEDRDFDTTWEACLGKQLQREKGVDLTDAELLANCLVNICFIARHPRAFEDAYQQLRR